MINEIQIKKRLAEAIENSDMSQTNIAKSIGVAQQQISCYMHGQKFPTLITFAKLCEVLDVDANYILGLKNHY